MPRDAVTGRETEQRQGLPVHLLYLNVGVFTVLADTVFQIPAFSTYIISSRPDFESFRFHGIQDVTKIIDKRLIVAFSIEEMQAYQVMSPENWHANSILKKAAALSEASDPSVAKSIFIAVLLRAGHNPIDLLQIKFVTYPEFWKDYAGEITRPCCSVKRDRCMERLIFIFIFAEFLDYNR